MMSGVIGTRELGVVVGCDCDPDRPRFGGARYDAPDTLVWRGVAEGTIHAREICDDFTDDSGCPVRITWCIRSDEQMRLIHGHMAWPGMEFADLWGKMTAAGDDLAWHPHLWRWDDPEGCWFQETEDAHWIEDCLAGGYEALAQNLDQPPCISRMGWEFHNDVSMATLRKLPIEVDFSAIPGRFTLGAPDRYGSRFAGHIDWRGAPEEAYVPADDDYRKPSSAGDDLVELPMSVFRSSPLAAIAALRRMRRRPLAESMTELTHAFEPLKAYITSPPCVFGRLASDRVTKALQEPGQFLVTAFHPDELLSDYASAGNSANNFRTNLERLTDLAQRRGVRLRFLTAGQALAHIKHASVGQGKSEIPNVAACG